MKKLVFRLVVPLLLVGQAAAWRWRQLPKPPCPSSPAMRHHRPRRRSCLQPLAASSGQGGGNGSISLGEGGGGVQPPRNEVHAAIRYEVVQLIRQESRWTEERMETQLKELKAGQEAQYKDIKAGQEKVREGLEKKMEAGQERMEKKMEAGQERMEKKMEAGQERMNALFRDLITSQEKMEERMEKKMEAQAKDSKAGQEKIHLRIQRSERFGIGAVAVLATLQPILANFSKSLL